jgi:hypothetical protein
MLRWVPPFLGLGLAVLWVMGMSEDATVWLTWADAAVALLVLIATGLVPARTGSLAAGAVLGLAAALLVALWITGLATGATPWLAWWDLVFAALVGLAAVAVAMQGWIDGVRVREPI